MNRTPMKFALALGTASLGLSGCSENRAIGSSAQDMAAEAVSMNEIVEDAAAEGDAPPVNAPQIAYTYRLGFRVPLGSIKSLQEKHAEQCENLSPGGCRIISMQQSRDDGDYASGRLEIAVVADNARRFSKDLETASGDLDAELLSSSLSGEDLSKGIIDTEARLRSRELLRDRLMDILASRQGTVAELVEAERGVAQVNQEIDQARSWLNEMRGRVAYSSMTITYEAGARSPVGGFSGPIVTAWNSLGGILGGVIAGLMIFVTAALPIAALLLALRWALHRFGYRLRFWKTDLRE